MIDRETNEAVRALRFVPNGKLIDVPVRPLNISLPKPARIVDTALVTALLWGDTHFPNHSAQSLQIVAAIAKETQPNFLIHMGDLVDTADLSEKFKKNPARVETLQDEINMGREHLAHMRILCPNARFIFLEGNHEERLTRVLWNMEGPARALSLLTDVQKVLTWPALLGLDFLDIEYAPYKEQSKFDFLPKFIVKHGNMVRPRSAYTARGEMEKYNKSGASGHTHRLAQYFHRDHNGNHVWLETGCTCTLDPDYTQDADWQNGAQFVTFQRDTGAFQAESIYIHNGNAVFRGKEYRAR